MNAVTDLGLVRPMRIVALFIGLLAAFAVYGVVTGGEPPILVFSHQISGRLESSLVVAGCAAALFGIYRRAKIIWWIGWVFLALCWFALLIGLLSPAEWRSLQPIWFAVIAHLLMIALAAYFTFRWYRQKSYFSRADVQEV